MKVFYWFVMAVLSHAGSLLAAESMLWKISDHDSSIHLLGSIHALNEERKVLPALYKAILETSDPIVFETEQDRLNDPSPFLVAEFQYPFFESIRNHVSQSTYEKLNDFRESHDYLAYDRYKAWFHALQVETTLLEKSGFRLANGVDNQLFLAARKKGKTLGALATLERHFDTFQDLNAEIQETMLLAALDLEEGHAEATEAFVAAWAEGNVVAMTSALDALREPAELFNAVIFDRNLEWLPLLENYMEANQLALVIVGVFHVVGEDGLLSMLEREGYSIQRRSLDIVSELSLRARSDGPQAVNRLELTGSSNTRWHVQFRAFNSDNLDWRSIGAIDFNNESATIHDWGPSVMDGMYRLRLVF